MKVAIYARYSSDNQRDASIADQLRICREFAARQGWTVVQEFTDHAISGATLLRSGFQALMRDALNRRFDVVLAESLDRFSRDQEDTAGLFKRLTFAGVNIVTLAEGDITHLHIGFKGTMNALFLKDLAEKTHRGLRGRIEDGKSAGGLCYGYRVVQDTQRRNRDDRRARNRTGASRRSSNASSGTSSLACHRSRSPKTLNREGVAGPFGGAWSPSTIYGNAKRGTGILNNELYVGRLVWNRLRYVKNPDTGKRVSRLNPSSEWMSKDVPHLRIVPDDLWTAAKARQKQTRHAIADGWQHWSCEATAVPVLGPDEVRRLRRRIHHAQRRTGCRASAPATRDVRQPSDHPPRGSRSARAEALQDKLLRQDLFEEFCDEFTREMNRLRMEHRASLSRRRARDRADRGSAQEADRDDHGRRAASEVRGRAERERGRREELKAKLAAADEPPPLLHPEMAGCTARRSRHWLRPWSIQKPAGSR